MLDLFIDASRFLFTILMFFCVFLSYRAYAVTDDERKKVMIFVQALCILLIHFTAYLIIFLETKNIETAVMYGLELFFIIIFMYAYHVLYPRSSMILLNNICLFIVIGFIMITRISIYKGQRQFVFVFAGGICSLVIPYLMTRIRGLRKLSWLYGTAGVLILLSVLIIGETDYGANISLSIAGISIQPSEFIKIVYIFFAAAMLNKDTSFKNICITSLIAALHVIVLVLSTDLGSAFIYFCVYVIMLYSATKKTLYAGLGVGAGAAASCIAYNLFSHVQTRVKVWLNPWKYIDDKGYQIVESLFSIGMGSWLGSGLYKGMPEKIPFVEKDFMFSAVAEEFGALFSMCLIMLCLNTVLLMIKTGESLKEPFYRLLAAGFASVYGIQVFLTIGGGMNIIPITGVTLPLVSYGGSSAVSTLMMFAVVQGLNLIDEGEVVEAERRKKSKKRKRK